MLQGAVLSAIKVRLKSWMDQANTMLPVARICIVGFEHISDFTQVTIPGRLLGPKLGVRPLTGALEWWTDQVWTGAGGYA